MRRARIIGGMECLQLTTRHFVQFPAVFADCQFTVWSLLSCLVIAELQFSIHSYCQLLLADCQLISANVTYCQLLSVTTSLYQLIPATVSYLMPLSTAVSFILIPYVT